MTVTDWFPLVAGVSVLPPGVEEAVLVAPPGVGCLRRTSPARADLEVREVPTLRAHGAGFFVFSEFVEEDSLFLLRP